MWLFDHTLFEIALRATIVYIIVLLGVRLTGKREIGQMTPFDLVLLLLLANAVQNAMTGPDTSVTGGLVAAATLLALNTIVTRIVLRHKKIEQWVEGVPTLLIRHGRVLNSNLVKENLTIEQLHQALREHGVATVAEVSLAVLEVDGSISVLKNDDLPASARPHHRIRFIRKER